MSTTEKLDQATELAAMPVESRSRVKTQSKKTNLRNLLPGVKMLETSSRNSVTNRCSGATCTAVETILLVKKHKPAGVQIMEISDPQGVAK